ncbi:zinc finger CCCH domain-containing protein 32-like [Amaranthus tricolor]|uniref:zinc finger CCCH domain-containing protein 32-like n=1 Tax=Amaranthus tricolor TaxID=29722 RepID=UPI00258BC763|nr:zinc finger CCCH domain-containing protein 32-like [Amaranthus tricolor]
MEEELLKRNTDCVYFLASPFTCKKGAECEYRHSEMARLNPRDCWYWLSGNCLNLTCAFRHPPLDVLKEASTKGTPPLPSQSSMPATKTTVPCYFYYNEFCNKGDKCPFLHEPGNEFRWKPKLVNVIADAPVVPLDSKKSRSAEAGPIPAVKHLIQSKMAGATGNTLQGDQKWQSQLSATNEIPKLHTSKQTYIPQCEETDAIETVSLQHAGGLSKSECEPSLDSDREPEDLNDGNIVRDELCESSPGFDVLVDGRTEDMVYEDDPDYLHALDENDRDCEHLFMPRGFSHQTDYDGGLLENSDYELSEYVQDELGIDCRKYSSRRTRDRKSKRVVSRKRNFSCVGSPIGRDSDMDLRDYLRKRRMIDGYLDTRDLRHDLVHVRDGRHDRDERNTSFQRLHGKIASKVERNGVKVSSRRNLLVDSEQHGRSGKSQHNGYRQHNGRKLVQCLTERSSYIRQRYPLQSSTFSGPKSLAEIKEDKNMGHFDKKGLVEFEGPKPLYEILKDKRKSASSQDDFTNSSNRMFSACDL